MPPADGYLPGGGTMDPPDITEVATLPPAPASPTTTPPAELLQPSREIATPLPPSPTASVVAVPAERPGTKDEKPWPRPMAPIASGPFKHLMKMGADRHQVITDPLPPPKPGVITVIPRAVQTGPMPAQRPGLPPPGAKSITSLLPPSPAMPGGSPLPATTYPPGGGVEEVALAVVGQSHDVRFELHRKPQEVPSNGFDPSGAAQRAAPDVERAQETNRRLHGLKLIGVCMD